jgi:copper(I)-binding protein
MIRDEVFAFARPSRPRRALLVAGALLFVAGAGVGVPAPADTPVSVRDAWVREPRPNRGVTAAFAVIENAGEAPRAIVSASSGAAANVELHEMKWDGAMMKMSPVDRIEVPAHGKTELKPGGLHIMLFGLKKPLVAGEQVELVLTLDDGSRVTVSAPVRKLEEPK